MIAAFAGNQVQPAPITAGTAPGIRSLPTDSATKSATISAEQDGAGVIRVSSSGLSPADTWVNIALPVSADLVKRGLPLKLAATLVIEQPSDLQVCLGILDGKEDVCTEKSKLSANRSALTISATPQPEGLLQFKLNIFPGKTPTPFAFRLEGLTLKAATR